MRLSSEEHMDYVSDCLLYKCSCSSVLLCVKIYIFCTECTKGLELASSAVRCCLCSSPTSSSHSSDSFRTVVCFRRQRVSLTCFLIGAATAAQRNCEDAARLHLSSLSEHLRPYPTPLFRVPLYAKLLCLHFTPMIVIKEQMERFHKHVLLFPWQERFLTSFENAFLLDRSMPQ